MNTRHSIRFLCQIMPLSILLLIAPIALGQGLESGKRDVDIATINLFVGADFSPVLSLDPGDPEYGPKLLAGVATIYGHILQSDFNSRADALARQIVGRGPDLIALQEVTQIRRQSPGDAIFGGTIPATESHLDYLATLLTAIERHGGHYEVVSQIDEVDVELPMLTTTGFVDLRLTDRDVILARTDLPPGHLRTFNAKGANFETGIPLPSGVKIIRGWCSIDVETRGRNFRLINTHLEVALPFPIIQYLQAVELLHGPAATSLPVVLAGDFNSDAYGNYGPDTYALLTNEGGFVDLWTVAGGQSPGLTWGHDTFLSDVTVPFSLRLDLILTRGRNLEATEGVVVDPFINPIPPFWFSDHAGVFGTIAIH